MGVEVIYGMSPRLIIRNSSRSVARLSQYCLNRSLCGSNAVDQLFHDTEIVARVGMCFTKASIILFYQRLFVPPGTRWTKIWWSIWFTFWWNLLYAIALVLAVAFECVGKEALVAAGKQCVDEFAVLVCASVINVTTDLMILFIPIAAIWGLHMPTEKKWRLSALFGVGTL